MSDHNSISEMLPLYVSGALEHNQRQVVEKHLAGCAECRSDLALWSLAAGEILTGGRAAAAPTQLAERALLQARRLSAAPSGLRARLAQAALLLRSQIPLVHGEIWVASAAVMALGYIVAVMAKQSGFVYALAPLIAAACVSFIYGPENDPGFELALSTPTSPRQILLARLALVFGYNLVLVLAATVALLPIAPLHLLGPLALTWLAPMTFLSAAALVISLWTGASNAISVTYIAWLARLIAGPLREAQVGAIPSPLAAGIMEVYQAFWQSPALLLALSAALFAAAVFLAGRQGRVMPQAA